MAFNPFAHFHRYKRTFMALAVLLCMVTFVLCSGGMKGMGLDDVLLKIFGNRGGDVIVEINGTSYRYEQLDALKKQRAIANDFMRELLKIAIDRLEAGIKQQETSGKSDPRMQFRLSLHKQCAADLQNKLERSSRYFLGGAKLDDLVDFIIWRDLATKNGVTITNEALGSYIRNACHALLWDGPHDDVAAAINEVIYNKLIRGNHYQASQEVVDEAVRQEFRVQIVQLATMARWLPTPEREQSANRQVGPNEYIHLYLNTPMQYRIVPTPEQLNAQYVKSRTEMTIDLLPISLETLAQQVALPKDTKERNELLKKFYDKYAQVPFNPAQDTPGFKMPAQAQIQFLTANADMEFYKQAAQVLISLQKTPPIAYDPLSPLSGALAWAATPASWDARLQKTLENERETVKYKVARHFMALANANERYWKETNEKTKADYKLGYELEMMRRQDPYKDSASPWTTPYYFSPGQFNLALEKPAPQTAAAAIAGSGAGPFAALGAYNSAAYGAQAKKIAPMTAVARAPRAIVGAELFLAQVPQFSGTGAFTAAALTYHADWTPQFLPVAGYLEQELQAKVEEQFAQAWVNEAMLDVKKQLETAKGETAFRTQIETLQDKYARKVTDKDGKTRTISGLQFGESADWRSEFDVEYDNGLKPLFDAFQKHRVSINTIEGRSGKPEMLKEADFGKLFFGGEASGVGPQTTFVPKVWPPNLTLPKARQSPLLAQKQLEQRPFDTDDKPIIFWKSAKRNQAVKPWNPDDPKMMELVETQYRINEARSKLMPEVKRIADEIRKVQRSENTDLAAKLRDLAAQNGTKVVTLPSVSMLVINTDIKTKGETPYVEYELPRGRIAHPRDDMVKQLLALQTLSAPLKADIEDPLKKGKTTETDPAAIRAKIDFDEINKLNDELFLKPADYKVKIPQVQALTNKPRDVVYLALVSSIKPPKNLEYLKEAPAEFSPFSSLQPTFADQVQQDFGKELLVLMSQYLREKAGVGTISDKARSQFGDETLTSGSQ